MTKKTILYTSVLALTLVVSVSQTLFASPEQSAEDNAKVGQTFCHICCDACKAEGSSLKKCTSTCGCTCS